ncbi:glycosyltransferase [Comamonas sp. lk]|uniref:glycosyltransferase n=1 Tax=Comamonas sp. lk TaxID=2201272 RepID=UPI000EAC4ED9|nr:glycosyltransferase [Comamonas sp. lk]
MNIVLIAHYYPPINSSGAKRAESLSKYFTALGHHVTVITTCKSRADGEFTEQVPRGVRLIELNGFGRERSSIDKGGLFEPMYSGKPSWKRILKDKVMAIFGQLPDPRLPFAMSFLSPWFSKQAKDTIIKADIVIGTTPPWSMVLAALFCKIRFHKACILDYRDHFSECHEMPGGRFSKWLEKIVDRWLVNSADHVVCISEPMTRYYKSLTLNVDTILNGYDHEILNQARAERDLINDGKVRIRYMGIVSPGRIPHNILKAVVEIKEKYPEFFKKLRFEFFGNAALLEKILIDDYSEISGAFHFFTPVRYFESLKKIVEADYLLFSETSSNKTLSAQGILTTKLFEYLGSGRPILADISKQTLAGDLLCKCGERNLVSQSSEEIFNFMSQTSFYDRAEDEFSPQIMSLSREFQAMKYADLINNISANKQKY